MPVKRRTTKRRHDVPADAWQFVFASGFDFFGDLEDFDMTEADARTAAKAAWAVHGAAFMAEWQGTPHKPLPWAAVTYGLPERVHHAS